MNIAGSTASIGYTTVAPSAAYRADRDPLPESTPDTSADPAPLAWAAGITVPRRSESIAQVESELSRQLTVNQATGSEADSAAPDATATSTRKASAAATSPDDNPEPPSPRPVQTDTAGQLNATAQLAVTQYQAHQALLDTDNDSSSHRISLSA
ncbi:flagellar hook-length control protein [Pseudogulbenkiania subflava]|uniref:Uncharacterized protein n=1 Tax=Pseudogulbenkiania subflava DSM 22618 TaxID=1123014 RepID=A0A1Y6C4H2_9NEIS|nr:flagellar hook-length control protein [Pseudogulbenkiania subflava]SMF45242.1 hypothetical protein SAMN02745746_03341 [Pseudogulbenkiania subflava DSM 22618]